MFKDEDGRPISKVADFGTSKIRPNDHTVLSSMVGGGDGPIVFTLWYAAPEVANYKVNGIDGRRFSKRFKSDV